MNRRKNPYPGVRKKHVKIYRKFERDGYRCTSPAPTGSPAFLAAYEAALKGAKVSCLGPLRLTPCRADRAIPGSLKFLSNLSDLRKRTIRLELDWLREKAGPYHRAAERPARRSPDGEEDRPGRREHREKNLSMLFNFRCEEAELHWPEPGALR